MQFASQNSSATVAGIFEEEPLGLWIAETLGVGRYRSLNAVFYVRTVIGVILGTIIFLVSLGGAIFDGPTTLLAGLMIAIPLFLSPSIEVRSSSLLCLIALFLFVPPHFFLSMILVEGVRNADWTRLETYTVFAVIVAILMFLFAQATALIVRRRMILAKLPVGEMS